METVITSKVHSHHTNPNYECLLVNLLHDPRFHYRIITGYLVSADWMPKDDDIIEIADQLTRLSPTFREKIFDRLMRTPKPVVQRRPLTANSNIAEVLF